MSKNNFHAVVLGLFIAIVIFSGGGFFSLTNRILVVSAASAIILALSLWRLRSGLPSRAAYFALIIMFLGVGLMALQLVPLPPQVWSGLAGRQFLNQDFALLGLSNQWVPLSLSPAMTRQDIISLLPGFAAFFGILSLSTKEWRVVVWSMVGIALFSALIGLAQKFQGQDGPFNFYHYTGTLTASGFFANRNFLAAELYCAVPFVAAMTMKIESRSPLDRRLGIFVGLACITVLIAAIGATGSRMGALLSVLSVLASIFLVFGVWRSSSSSRRRLSSFYFIGILGGSLLMAQLLLVALLRFTETDIATDYRGTMLDVSLTTFKAFFPVGSGFGSFVPVYQLFEQPSILISSYVNHAHNDWLELLIEGGLPIGIVLFGFLVWFVCVTIMAWRSSKELLFAKAASIGALLLMLHSLVDYPLRAPGLMCLFGLFCGIMAVTISTRNSQIHVSRKQQPSPSIPAELPVGFRPNPRGFSQRGKSKP